MLEYRSAAGRWVIAACVLGSGIASLDATVVGIALPAIGRSFHAGIGTLQWVSTGYLLTLAAFLLLGGALGDRYGRRRLFVVGVIWFAASSALCGLAPDAGVMIAARVSQGVGASMLTPASLAILQASFVAGDRPKAIGAWSGLGGLATAAGPLVGGYLIAAASWRWVFFINVPVSLVVLAVTARHVPESRDPDATGSVDAPGAALAVLALGGLTAGLIEGPSLGWSSPAIVVAFVVAVGAGFALWRAEHRRPDPMLPLGLFAARQFSAANAVTFVVYGALGGALFLVPVELQVVDGYSALGAGASLLPVTALMLVFSSRSGALAARIGPRLQMSVGPVVVGVGLALLARTVGGHDYLTDVLPAVVCFGAGLAFTVAPLTSTALGAAPTEHAGAASAVNSVVARAAGLVAVAVLPVAVGLGGDTALRADTVGPAFRLAVIGAGAVCAAGGVLAALVITDPPHARHRPHLVGRCPLDAPPRAAEAQSPP